MPRLSRTVAIERLLLDHLDVLETMGPEGFLEFRDPLEPASGFQSVQFRRISGSRACATCSPPTPSRRPARASTRRSRAAGLPEDEEARMDALADLYRDHEDDPVRAWLYRVAELLIDHDEGSRSGAITTC